MFAGYDPVRGQSTVDEGIDLNVRWNFSRSEVGDPKKTTVSYDATVLVAIEVLPQSLMWPGSTDWLLGTAGPVSQSGGQPLDVYEVKKVSVTRDVKGRAVLRQLGLMRCKAKLPAVVGRFFTQLGVCNL